MQRILRIGTRDSQLAVWQATQVQQLLKEAGAVSELVYMKSEGDIDTVTPLYALGVTGVFTKTLDAALLNNRIDIAVHSMKDVPVQLAQGIRQAAVLKRGSHKDLFVPHPELKNVHTVLEAAQPASVAGQASLAGGWDQNTSGNQLHTAAIVATSSIRRIAQWRRRYPHHHIENLRGNVNTRLRKLKESNWAGAIFAAAGLERIGLRPANAIDLDWMLPAPAQGAIMVVCREEDEDAFRYCQPFNHQETAFCTKIERDFLTALMGGCSTPISALAEIMNGEVYFKGNVVSPDNLEMAETEMRCRMEDARDVGSAAARDILLKGGASIMDRLRKKGLSNDEQA